MIFLMMYIRLTGIITGIHLPRNIGLFWATATYLGAPSDLPVAKTITLPEPVWIDMFLSNDDIIWTLIWHH